MKRSQRAEIARETVEIVERGYYEVANQRIELMPFIQQCLQGTRFIPNLNCYNCGFVPIQKLFLTNSH